MPQGALSERRKAELVAEVTKRGRSRRRGSAGGRAARLGADQRGARRATGARRGQRRSSSRSCGGSPRMSASSRPPSPRRLMATSELDPTTGASGWHPTACILCECNCGIEVAARRPAVRADPRRQGASRVAGLHLQQGDAPRPLPERPRPADESRCAAAPTAASRRSTGTPRSPRSPSGSRRSATSTAARRSSTTAAAARATTSAARTAARSSRALGARYRSSALAQEKMGEWFVDGAALRRPHPGRLRARRGGGVRRQEPVAVAEHPARAGRRCASSPRDPDRALIVIDPVRDRDGRDGRLPPAGAAGHRRLVPRGAARRDRRRRGSSTSAFLDEHTNGSTPVLAALAEVPVAEYAARCGVDGGADPRRRPADRAPPRACRRSRISASSRRRTARSAPTSTSCCGC